MNEFQTDPLFDMESVKLLSPRMKVITEAIKNHDIKTHYADIDEWPWMAIPMNKARESFKKYDTKCEWKDCASITMSIGRLLEEAGMIFYGETEDEVIYAAMDYLSKSNEL